MPDMLKPLCLFFGPPRLWAFRQAANQEAESVVRGEACCGLCQVPEGCAYGSVCPLSKIEVVVFYVWIFVHKKFSLEYVPPPVCYQCKAMVRIKKLSFFGFNISDFFGTSLIDSMQISCGYRVRSCMLYVVCSLVNYLPPFFFIINHHKYSFCEIDKSVSSS